ncbi:MAG: hypothetical protein WCS01_11825, partial [bacterium]
FNFTNHCCLADMLLNLVNIVKNWTAHIIELNKEFGQNTTPAERRVAPVSEEWLSALRTKNTPSEFNSEIPAPQPESFEELLKSANLSEDEMQICRLSKDEKSASEIAQEIEQNVGWHETKINDRLQAIRSSNQKLGNFLKGGKPGRRKSKHY